MQLIHACLLGLLVSHAAATRLRVEPNLDAKVAAESQENIQIHDGFLSQEKSDTDQVSQLKANKDLSALRLRVEPNLDAKVAAESQENIQIHDGFLSQEKSDTDEMGQVKANKDLSALSFGHRVVGLDHDLKTQILLETQSNSSLPAIKDACSGVECGNLQCPAGFAATTIDGHCCPYCVNPDIKVEAAVTGATGSLGGKESTFCPDVWCFPTLCTKAEVNPTTTNGQCCPTCPALL